MHPQLLVTPLLFGVGVVLFSMQFPWHIKGLFLAYSAFIFWTLAYPLHAPYEPRRPTAHGRRHHLATIVITAAVVMILATRLIPFLRFGEAPLGYDTGFYVGSIKSLVDAGTPASSALYLTLTPLFAAGLDPNILYHVFHIATQLFLAGALYLLLTSIPVPQRRNLAAIAVLLYALSVVQFLGYWWAFTQQMLGMGFFLMTIALFIRQSYWVLAFAPLTFLVHTPTGAALFLTFVLTYLVYLIQLCTKRRSVDRYLTTILIVGVVLIPIALLSKWNDITNLFGHVFSEYGVLLKNVPRERLLEFRGLFVVPEAFRLLVLGIVPFSLFAVLHPNTWTHRRVDRRFCTAHLLILYATLTILLVLSFTPVIYQSRFSIILDLLLLTFAAPAALRFAEYFARDLPGKVLIGILSAFFLVSMGLQVRQQHSMISNEELQELKRYTSIVEPTAGILATDSLYAPWLWGFFRWSTMSPGYLGDSWDYATWARFWSGDDDDTRFRLLAERDHPPPPLYLHIGNRQTRDLPFERWVRSTEVFTRVAPNLWKFSGDPRASSVDVAPTSPSQTFER